MEKHITLVAVFHITFGIILLIAGIVIFALLTGIGILSQEPEAFAVFSAIATVVGLILFIVSIPMIIGGVGLLKRRSWARILVLIVSVIALFKIPVGTAIGIYSIWAMLQNETKEYLNQ
jgi:Ni,Fe-hydrogenase I cytochrome b subunit